MNLEQASLKTSKETQFQDNTKEVLLINGPPYTTGDFHIGHGVNLVQKDFWMWYNHIFEGKNTKTTDLQYKWTFDTQGLPIENKICKELNCSNRRDLIDQKVLVKKCIDYSDNTAQNMSNVMNKMGLYKKCVDPVLTNDVNYKVTLMNHIIKLYQQNYIKKSIKHQNYCFNCGTSVANAQIELVRKAYSVYVLEANIKTGLYKDYKLLYSTTFPETCVSSMAIALSSKAEYCAYEGPSEQKSKNTKIITADPFILNKLPLFKKVSSVNFGDLVNQEYEIRSKKDEVLGCSKIITADELVITLQKEKDNLDSLKMDVPFLAEYACVNLNPYFSEVDYQAVKKASKSSLSINDFDLLVLSLTSKDPQILSKALFKMEEITKKREYYMNNLNELKIWFEKKYNAAYNCCWRCKARVDTILMSQYQLELPLQERQEMVRLLHSVTFNNEGLKTKTINFFEKDHIWPISRSRVYGTPLPFVKCNTCFRIKPISFEVSDFKFKYECYTPFLKEVIDRKDPKLLNCACGETMDFEKYSLDVWLDSGILPIILKHKADVFIEGLDQTRGWFYSTSVLNYLENKRLPFDALLYLGWIARNNEKLSKSSNTDSDFYLKNVIAEPEMLLFFRSFAVAKGSYNTVNYSKQILEQEKKYVNVYKNILKLLERSTFPKSTLDQQRKFLDNHKNEEVNLKGGPTKIETVLDGLDSLLKEICTNVYQYRFNLYWLTLRKYMLNVYSRDLVNSLNRSTPSELESTLISYIGGTLKKHIKPIFGSIL